MAKGNPNDETGFKGEYYKEHFPEEQMSNLPEWKTFDKGGEGWLEISSHDKLMEAKPNCKSHFTASENTRTKSFLFFSILGKERECYKFYCIVNMFYRSTEQINNHILIVGRYAGLPLIQTQYKYLYYYTIIYFPH